MMTRWYISRAALLECSRRGPDGKYRIEGLERMARRIGLSMPRNLPMKWFGGQTVRNATKTAWDLCLPLAEDNHAWQPQGTEYGQKCADAGVKPKKMLPIAVKLARVEKWMARSSAFLV